MKARMMWVQWNDYDPQQWPDGRDTEDFWVKMEARKIHLCALLVFIGVLDSLMSCT